MSQMIRSWPTGTGSRTPCGYITTLGRACAFTKVQVVLPSAQEFSLPLWGEPVNTVQVPPAGRTGSVIVIQSSRLPPLPHAHSYQSEEQTQVTEQQGAPLVLL